MYARARRLIHRIPTLATLLISLALALAGAAPVAGAVRYVTPGGATSGPCDSWANACSLQTALGVAVSGDEAWVEMGVYKPGTHGGDTFIIPPGVAVYGGFAGAEAFRAQRDPAANVTVLSGDIGNDDMVDANGADTDTTKIVGTNSAVVVTMNATASSKVLSDTVLDGFTITGAGSAPGAPTYAGLWCDNTQTSAECSPTLSNLTFSGNFGHAIINDAVAASSISSPTLTNVTFSGNSGPGGSAMFNHAASGTVSSPTLTNVTFSNNHSSTIGGAMFNQAGGGGTSSPVLTNVTFSGNSAGTDGGAMYNEGSDSGTSSPVLTNVTFSGNSAVTNGGAIYNHASGASQSISSPTLTNVTFSGNSAGDSGGAIYNNTGSSDYFGVINLVLTNVTFSGNSAGSEGGAMRDESGLGTIHPTLTNVIFWGDSVGTRGNGPEICDGIVCSASGAGPGVTMDHSVYPSFCPGACTNIVATDPLLGPLQDNGGPTETMALGTGSSAIDTGTNTGCPATDQRGVARPQDGDGNGTAICDIGAYELDTTAPTVTSTSLQSTYVVTGPSSLTVTFSEPVNDPTGDSDPDDVTNPANYLLVEAGGNGTFDTQSCLGGVVTDDTQVPISSVSYDGGSMTATVNLGSPLPLGTYRLFVCGTTSITDIAGNKLNGGTDSTFDFAAAALTAIPTLSFTGLALLALLLAGAGLALRRQL